MLSQFVAFLVSMLQKLEQALADVEARDVSVPAGTELRDVTPETIAEPMQRGIAWPQDAHQASSDCQDVFLFRQASSLMPASSPTAVEAAGEDEITLYDLIVQFLSTGDSEAQIAEGGMGFDLSSLAAGPTVTLILEL